MSSRILSRELAEAALQAVIAKHQAYIDAGCEPPILLPPERSMSQDCWEIVWEDGPFEWAYRASLGGVDEELAELAADVMPRDRAVALATEQPGTFPAGVYVEPYSDFRLCLYRDE